MMIMLQLDKTIRPHQGQTIFYSGTSIENADSAMILLHGRGANAASMKFLISEFESDCLMYIIPEATNFTWYPYRFIEKREANEPDIRSGLLLIDSIVNALNKRNIPKQNTFILGFSQGACLAVDYAARYPARFAGVFALSGGLIGDTIKQSDYDGNLKQTPVFFGCSDTDFHIPKERVDESAQIFEILNADVTKRIYPKMGHTINRDELNFINEVMSEQKVLMVTANR
jgi:phospholipase/carboxylesterase